MRRALAILVAALLLVDVASGTPVRHAIQVTPTVALLLPGCACRPWMRGAAVEQQRRWLAKFPSAARSAVNIEVKLSDAADAHIVKNLWPLYQQDVSEFEPGLVLNRHGLFGVDDSVTTLAQHADALRSWWKEPESLFPYLILVDGYPAGFNLIAARPRLPDGLDADFLVHEFFVLHAYRGKGVAERAAMEGFNRHRGQWVTVTWPTHARAIAFWRRVVSGYVPTGHSEKEVDLSWGRRVALSFDNSATEHSDAEDPRQRA